MFLGRVFLVSNLLFAGILFASATCFATSIEVVFKNEQGAPLADSSVTVIKANGFKDYRTIEAITSTANGRAPSCLYVFRK